MMRMDVERAPTWAREWEVVDRALRSIAQRRAALDAEEAQWLRQAEEIKIWRPLGMVSALDYLERALGYGPRAAQDRLRVARALGDLPEITDALASGALPFTAVRELTRVATRRTERAWVDAGQARPCASSKSWSRITKPETCRAIRRNQTCASAASVSSST